MEGKEREIPKAILQDLKVAAQIKDMIHTEGWKQYKKLLEAKLREKTDLAFLPVNAQLEVDGITQVLVGESAKGAIMGLRLALELPDLIVLGAERARQQFKISSSTAEGD
jgi:hypothetical protein